MMVDNQGVTLLVCILWVISYVWIRIDSDPPIFISIVVSFIAAWGLLVAFVFTLIFMATFFGVPI